jgi:hypothetical protein
MKRGGKGGTGRDSTHFKGGSSGERKEGGSGAGRHTPGKGRGARSGVGEGVRHDVRVGEAGGATLLLEPVIGEVHGKADGWAPRYSPGRWQFDLIQIRI